MWGLSWEPHKQEDKCSHLRAGADIHAPSLGASWDVVPAPALLSPSLLPASCMPTRWQPPVSWDEGGAVSGVVSKWRWLSLAP